MARWGWRVLGLGLALSLGFSAWSSAQEEALRSPMGLRVLDIEGRLHVLGNRPESKGSCLVILGIGCPVSNEVLPELGRLSKLAAASDIEFFTVVSDPYAERSEAVELHARFEVPFPILFDTNGVLAERLQPRTTPESFLYDARGGLVYRGRIDDRGVNRIGENVPRNRDLLAALEALSQGKPVSVARTGGIGCAYEGWWEIGATELTWAKNVAPILEANCVDCHRMDGPAPFPLRAHEEAARRSKMIDRVARERTMPRWHAAPGFGDLLDERVLDEREVRVLELWSLTGAKRGKDSDAVERRFELESARLGEPDLVLSLPDAITLAAEGPDVFRAFMLPTGLTEDSWLRAAEFRFEDPRLVRRAILFEQRQTNALDAGRGEPGHDASQGQQFTSPRFLAGWLPGTLAEPFPDGVGRQLEAKSDLLLWLHLHPSGAVERKDVTVALWFEPQSVREEIVVDVIRGAGAPILRDAHEGFRIHVEHRLGKDTRLLAVTPRMDAGGMEMKLVARPPVGPELPLVQLLRWDVSWPERYRFRVPVALPAGTLLVLDARFGDSARVPVFAGTLPELLPIDGEVPELCRCYLELIEPFSSEVLGVVSEPSANGER